MSSVATASSFAPARTRWPAQWIGAWKEITREQCIGAGLLGLVVVTPTILQFGISPIRVGWGGIMQAIGNTQISAFALLLSVTLADQAADHGRSRIVAYGIAVVVAALAGAMLSALHSELLWSAISNPDAIIRRKLQVNPWVPYTRYVYQAIEWTLVGGLATYLYVDRREARRLIARLHEAGLRRSAQAKTMLESQLQTLQARVEPQFLFETLRRVRDLYEGHASAADRMLDELILYLRAAMPRMRDTAAELAQELDLVQAWLAIVDTPGTLAMLIDCPPDAQHARIPSMLLLPLVSSLIGLRGSDASPAILRVCARADGARLRVALALDGVAVAAEPLAPVIPTLRERLSALFGTEAALEVQTSARDVQAVLEIPHENADGADR